MPRGRKTSGRLPIALSATALVVALFGSTPIGEAAKQPIVSFAKRAGFAGNAGKVNGIQASRTAKPGLLLALGKDGKFPAAVVPAGAAGSTGPAGPTGDKGDKGDKGDAGAQGAPGVSGRELVTDSSPADSAAEKSAFAVCPAGKKAIGGGAFIVMSFGTAGPALTQSGPVGGDTGWVAHAREIGTYTSSWVLKATAVCATVDP